MIARNGNQCIEEINGIFWHCKPTLYDSSYHHSVRNITAKEIWEFDERKRKLAKEKGYDVLTIWEDEFYNNSKQVIENCIKFLK